MKGIQWAGRRVGVTTSALIIIQTLSANFQSEELTSTEFGDQLIKAFSNAACLRNLRQFGMHFTRLLSNWRQGFESFSDWVLEQTVSLAACDLTFARNLCLAAGTLTLQWLRHLIISSHLFQAASFNAAKQLPVLETMRIDGFCGASQLDLVDVSGCMHLRRLAIEEVIVLQLLKRLECLLSYKPGRLNYEDPLTRGASHLLRAADRVTLDTGDRMCPPLEHGIFGALPCAEVVIIGDQGWGCHPPSAWFDTELVLAHCMPADGKPFKSLRSLLISTSRMKGCIPTPQQLPNLEELVIATSMLQLSFEDPAGTFSALKTCYIYAYSLIVEGFDSTRMAMSDTLRRRGLTLSEAAGAVEFAGNITEGTCLYVRPNNEHELTIQRCLRTVMKLTECRCGACFRYGCLKMAGSL